MTKHAARMLLASAAMASVVALAACAPPAGKSDTDVSSPVEVSTDISDVPEQTLVVWDQEVRGGQNEQMERLNAAFMEKYPQITIERNSQSFDDLNTTLRLALTGNDAPDVVQANNSRGMLGQFVAAEQVQSLEPWAAAYGWGDRFSESALLGARYTEDGTGFGQGNVYGLPQTGEIVGLFYNKNKLTELGLDVPRTWDDFTSQLPTIAAAGETPISLGNVEKWTGIHVFGLVQAAHVPTDDILNLGYGNAGSSWQSDENLAAAEEIRSWADKGYFNDGFNGTDDAQMAQLFASGDAVYMLAGSWNAADLAESMGDSVGFIPAPEGNAGLQATGGTGIPFTITSAAKDPNVAAAYIDFITSDEAMEVLAETGNIPVNKTADFAADQDGVIADVMVAFSEVSSNGTLLPYLDWATPTFDQDLGDALQALLDGQGTPSSFTETLETAYTSFTQP